MGENYTILSKFIDENDFIDKQTNLYAKINDTYYLKVNRRFPQEIAIINGVFSFYYCRVRKTREHCFREEAESSKYIVAEKAMDAKEFLEISSPYSPTSTSIAEYLKENEDIIICINSYTDEYGTTYKLAIPLFEGDIKIDKPKTLGLTH